MSNDGVLYGYRLRLFSLADEGEVVERLPGRLRERGVDGVLAGVGH